MHVARGGLWSIYRLLLHLEDPSTCSCTYASLGERLMELKIRYMYVFVKHLKECGNADASGKPSPNSREVEAGMNEIARAFAENIVAYDK